MSVSYIPPPGDEKFVFWKNEFFRTKFKKIRSYQSKIYNIDELGRSESGIFRYACPISREIESDRVVHFVDYHKF
jgi:hypothetical protein